MDVQNSMTDEEYQAMDEEWARMIVDLYLEKLPETSNLESQSTTVQLEKDTDGYYIITEDDFNRLDGMIIDYSSAPSSEA